MTLLAVALWAAEIAVFTSGFTMPIERHEVRGADVILHAGEGVIVLPRAALAALEATPEPEPEPPSTANPPAPEKSVRELLREAAGRHGLPAAFVEAVARQESNLDPAAVSAKGAIGLMQLMPGTAAALGVDPRDPAQNSEGGAKLLRELLLAYRDEPDQVRRALAAYNAGPGAVKKYNGVPPYRETQDYIERVLRHYRARTPQFRNPRQVESRRRSRE
jgi:soluble lytic murein transglycosylase-like protein